MAKAAITPFAGAAIAAPLAAAAAGLERTLDRFTETFESFPKTTIRRKLRKNGDKIGIEVFPNGIQRDTK